MKINITETRYFVSARYNITMGDVTEPARNRLIIAHMHLVEPIASDYRGQKGIPFEDLVGAGRDGLVTAAQRYNANLSRFSTYATEFIRGYIQHFIRDWQHLIPVGGGEEIERHFHEWDIWGSAAPYETWTQLVATPEDLTIAFDNLRDKHAKLQAAFQHLPKMERSIIHARYFRDPPQTLNSLAREFHIPYATLVDFINRTLKKLAENVESREAAIPSASRGSGPSG